MEKILEDFLNPNMQVAFYVILSVVLGSIIGLERELTNKWAGLRTHMLVCMGSCIFTILSIHGFPPHELIGSNGHTFAVGDPARIAAQIITGIGFIGGGTVLRHGTSIHGLTTAATLWISASIGMACGAMMGNLAIGSTIIAISVLVFIRFIEKKFIHSGTKNLKQFKIIINCKNLNSQEIVKKLDELFVNMTEFSLKKSELGEDFDKLVFKVEISNERPLQNIHKMLNSHSIEYQTISIQEIYE